MEIPWELKRYIDAQKQNMVNFSALALKAEALSDGTTRVYIDSRLKEVVFETYDNGMKKHFSINIVTGFIHNLRRILFVNSGAISGVINGKAAFETLQYAPSDTLVLNEVFAFNLGVEMRNIMAMIDALKEIDKTQTDRLVAIEGINDTQSQQISTNHEAINNCITFDYYEEHRAELKGDKGDKGNKGDKGDKGDQGATGPRGPQGKDGEDGDSNTWYQWLFHGANTLANVAEGIGLYALQNEVTALTAGLATLGEAVGVIQAELVGMKVTDKVQDAVDHVDDLIDLGPPPDTPSAPEAPIDWGDGFSDIGGDPDLPDVDLPIDSPELPPDVDIGDDTGTSPSLPKKSFSDWVVDRFSDLAEWIRGSNRAVGNLNNAPLLGDGLSDFAGAFDL